MYHRDNSAIWCSRLASFVDSYLCEHVTDSREFFKRYIRGPGGAWSNRAFRVDFDGRGRVTPSCRDVLREHYREYAHSVGCDERNNDDGFEPVYMVSRPRDDDAWTSSNALRTERSRACLVRLDAVNGAIELRVIAIGNNDRANTTIPSARKTAHPFLAVLLCELLERDIVYEILDDQGRFVANDRTDWTIAVTAAYERGEFVRIIRCRDNDNRPRVRRSPSGMLTYNWPDSKYASSTAAATTTRNDTVSHDLCDGAIYISVFLLDMECSLPVFRHRSFLPLCDYRVLKKRTDAGMVVDLVDDGEGEQQEGRVVSRAEFFETQPSGAVGRYDDDIIAPFVSDGRLLFSRYLVTS